MSEAHQPTLEYSGPGTKPAVPFGTMIEEISLRPRSSRPVMASTVTREVIEVPALVMKALLPSTTQLVVLEPGRGPHAAGDVGSAARLGQAEGGQPLPRAQLGQPPAALLLGAEPVDRHRAERHPGFQRDRDRGIDPGQFLQGQAEREVVAAHAAVLFGERQAEQAELAHPGHDVVGELAALVVAADDRRDHLAGELGDGVPQVLLLRRELVTDHDTTFARPDPPWAPRVHGGPRREGRPPGRQHRPKAPAAAVI